MLVAFAAVAALFALPFAVEGQGSGFNPRCRLPMSTTGPTRAWAQQQHYVVLVSLDGFRWDYAKRDDADASAGAGQEGRLGAGGHDAELSVADVSQPLHHRHRALSRASRAGGQQLLRSRARSARYCDHRSRRPSPTEAGIAACRCGAWPRARGCARPASSGRVRKRRSPATGPRGMRGSTRKDQVTASRAGAHRRCGRAAAPARRGAAALHRHLLLRAGPRGPRVRSRCAARRKAACCKMDADDWQAEGGARRHRAADRPGGGERSRHGEAEGGWITLEPFADLTGFETAGSLLYGKTEEDRARVYNQLKKASSQFIVYRLQGRAGRS